MTFSKTEIQKAKTFLNTQGKKIAFYHRDADGVSSAALLLKAFPYFDCRPKGGPVLGEDFIKEMSWESPDLIVFLDLPVDQEWRFIKRAVKEIPSMKILVIDHHIIEKNLNSKNTLHLNPRFKKSDIYLPTSFLIYEILDKLNKDIEEFCWIAAIGVIGDYAFKECSSFLKKCEKNHPFLGRAEELVSGAITLKKFSGAERVLDILKEAESYREFLQKKQLIKWREKVDREFKRCVISTDNKKEVHPDIKLRIYTLKTKMSLLSNIATFFSEKHPDDVVLVRKENEEAVKVSARCQSGRVNVADLVKKASKGLGSGGGHHKAAGASVNDWNLFIVRVIRKLRKSEND